MFGPSLTTHPGHAARVQAERRVTRLGGAAGTRQAATSSKIRVDMNFGALVTSLAIAAFEIVLAVGLETRLAVALGRRPGDRLVSMYLNGLPRSVSRQPTSAAILAVLLLLFQAFPLARQGILGATQSPDPISGAGVIIVELMIGAGLWLGMRPIGESSGR